MKVNDRVVRKKYNKDTIFRIMSINNGKYELKGVSNRLLATADIDDLELTEEKEDFSKYERKVNRSINLSKKYLTGKILHLDGDSVYLDKCLNLYREIGLFAVGFVRKETEVHKDIVELVEHFNPDIIVITGHDSFNNKDMKDVSNYKHSKFFYEAVQRIRKKYSKDEKIIIAGACQSHFELLVAGGANFASSPKRVNIHAYDPAIIAIKASVTSFERTIDMDQIIRLSYIKRDGLGGIETKGKMKMFV